MVGFPAVPSLRQVVLLSALWAVAAWLVTALWGIAAQEQGFADALTAYYAVRAPVVGAVGGALWAPFLVNLPLNRAPSAVGGPEIRLAVEPRTRRALRVIQGVLVGQAMGATVTILLLFLWPNDYQNDRMDALKWGLLFWKLYWYLLPPSGAVVGVLSVWIAVRRPRPMLG